MSLEDALWSIAQQTRRLEEFRRVVLALWTDAAAGDLAERRLDPHQAAAEAMLQALADQREALRRAEGWLDQVDDNAGAAERRAAAVHEALEQARSEISGGWKIHELAARFTAQACDRLPAVEACLGRAEDACR